MTSENEVQPECVAGEDLQQVLQAARNIIEADIADMEECDRNGGCGEDHTDEIAHGASVLKRIDRVMGNMAVGVGDPHNLTAAMLYGEFCETVYAASWIEPTPELISEFEAWIPGGVVKWGGSDLVGKRLPELKAAYNRALARTDEVTKATAACEYLAGLPESHWTVDVRLEGDEGFGDDEYGEEDRVRFLMDHERRLLGVQIVDYAEGQYGYLDTFTGRVNVPVGDKVVTKAVSVDCDRIDAHHKEMSLWLQ